jgi:hypothetical protein
VSSRLFTSIVDRSSRSLDSYLREMSASILKKEERAKVVSLAW